MRIISILIVIYFSACHSDDFLPIVEPPQACLVDCDSSEVDNQYQVLWQTSIVPGELNWGLTRHGTLHNGHYSLVRMFRGTENMVQAWDIESGTKVWGWDDPTASLLDGSSIAALGVGDNQIVLGGWSDVIILSNEDGNTLWQTDVRPAGDGNPRLWVENEFIFHTHQESTSNNDYENEHLVVSSVQTPAWDTLLIISKTANNGYLPSIESTKLWRHPNRDQIILFQNRQWNFSIGDGKIDLYAYNWSADSILWRIDDVAPSGNSSVSTILTEGGRLFFLGAHTVSCINAANGDLIWQWQTPGTNGEHFLDRDNIVYVENKIIVKPSNDNLYALNPDNGQVIWKNEEGGSSPTGLTHYNGKVYYTGIDWGQGKIFAHDITTGLKVWEFTTPNDELSDNYFSSAGIQIDPTSGRLYTADNYYVMCIQLPKD